MYNIRDKKGGYQIDFFQVAAFNVILDSSFPGIVIPEVNSSDVN